MKTFTKGVLLISSMLVSAISYTANATTHEKTSDENTGYFLVYLTNCSHLYYKIGETQKGHRAKIFTDNAIKIINQKEINLDEIKNGAVEAQTEWNNVKTSDDPHKQYSCILLCNYMYNNFSIDDFVK